MKITKIELTNEERALMLTDAIEMHSIDYWALDYELIKVWRDGEGVIYKTQIKIDDDNGKVRTRTLTPEHMQAGVDLILSGKVQVRDDIRDMIVEDDNDSDSLDCIIQAALFGEIIYG